MLAGVGHSSVYLNLLQFCFQALGRGVLVVTPKTLQIGNRGGNWSEAVDNISSESSALQVVIDPITSHTSLDSVLEGLFEGSTGGGEECDSKFLKITI